MRNVLGLVALALTLVLSAGPQAVAAFDDASLIAEVRSGWQEAMNERDLSAMLTWYAPGAVVLPAKAAPRSITSSRWSAGTNLTLAEPCRSTNWASRYWTSSCASRSRISSRVAISDLRALM